jgi:hypothetical protein
MRSSQGEHDGPAGWFFRQPRFQFREFAADLRILEWRPEGKRAGQPQLSADDKNQRPQQGFSLALGHLRSRISATKSQHPDTPFLISDFIRFKTGNK